MMPVWYLRIQTIRLWHNPSPRLVHRAEAELEADPEAMLGVKLRIAVFGVHSGTGAGAT